MAAACVSGTKDLLKTSHDYDGPQPSNPFCHLVQQIKEHLGKACGIHLDATDVEYLESIMSKYTSNPADWRPYARTDPSKQYTRNCVEDINDKANIVSPLSKLNQAYSI